MSHYMSHFLLAAKDAQRPAQTEILTFSVPKVWARECCTEMPDSEQPSTQGAIVHIGFAFKASC